MVKKIVLFFCSTFLLVSCSSCIGKRSISSLTHLPAFEKDVGSNKKVFFNYDSALLSQEAKQSLEHQAKWLKEHPAVSTAIEGHCDERGTRDYNIALGERRAQTIKDFLVQHGIDPKRIETISYGKEKPEVAGDNETSWSKNRRGVTVLK